MANVHRGRSRSSSDRRQLAHFLSFAPKETRVGLPWHGACYVCARSEVHKSNGRARATQEIADLARSEGARPPSGMDAEQARFLWRPWPSLIFWLHLQRRRNLTTPFPLKDSPLNPPPSSSAALTPAASDGGSYSSTSTSTADNNNAINLCVDRPPSSSQQDHNTSESNPSPSQRPFSSFFSPPLLLLRYLFMSDPSVKNLFAGL